MLCTKHPGYAGYLFFHDDVMMNPKNFRRLDKKNIWMAYVVETVNLDIALDPNKCSGVWFYNYGQNAMKQVSIILTLKLALCLMKILVIAMEHMDIRILHLFHRNA